ncbi:PIN domain-containing protein [Candidatus Aerophobetes bacterium]|nr:PIN domain-containing protein [Candidatus Aerophobetes bacterium]
MGRIEAKILVLLRKYSVVGIDTMGFIYHFEKNEDYLPFTKVLFSSIEAGTIKAVTSMITLLEILVKPKKEKNKRLVEEYKFLLHTFPNLKILPFDERIADVASSLRAEYNIKTPDAIQVTSSILAGAKAFITNEPSLKRINEFDIIVMKEMLGI